MYIIEKPRKIDLLKIVKRKSSVRHCHGCEDNFYNGHNPHGVKRCWMLDSARLVRRKEIGMSDIPPWTWQPVGVMPHCFRKRGYVYVGKDQIC